MLQNLTPFLLHWGITALSLWVASHVSSGLKFANVSSLIVSALLLGFANAIVKPLLILLTLPLTLLTFGLFILVERNQARPMIDLQLMRSARFIGALLGMFAYAACAQVMISKPWRATIGRRLWPALAGR